MTDQNRGMSTDATFPALHRVHPRGWLNDPNGILRHEGRWHVFFQHNPDAPRHDRIRWGHASSPDLVTWREEPLGPVPRAGEHDAGGCWSGVATVRDGVPHLVYSGVDGRNDGLARVIVQPMSADLSALAGEAVTAADIPAEPGLAGLRDPFLFTWQGRELAIQGAELLREGGVRVPALLVWDRADLRSWRYLGVMLTGEDPVAARWAPADLWECPQLVPLRDEVTGEDRWVLSLGRWTEPDASGAAGLNGVSYLVGDLEDDGTGIPRFRPTGGGDMDEGPDFYAPQAYLDGQRVLLWGWSWEAAGRTQEQADAQGWAGCLTFPRELRLVEGQLCSAVPRELEALRGEPGRGSTAEGGEIELVAPAHAEVRSADGLRVELLDRDGGVREVVAEVADGPLTAMFDASILEVLPERGTPRTLRLYPEAGERLRVSGRDLAVWELRVPISR